MDFFEFIRIAGFFRLLVISFHFSRHLCPFKIIPLNGRSNSNKTFKFHYSSIQSHFTEAQWSKQSIIRCYVDGFKFLFAQHCSFSLKKKSTTMFSKGRTFFNYMIWLYKSQVEQFYKSRAFPLLFTCLFLSLLALNFSRLPFFPFPSYWNCKSVNQVADCGG